MIAVAILFAALAIILPFVVGVIADRKGPHDPSRSVPRVSERFLERSTQYDADSLKTWATAYPEAARWYAWPVLFPLDFLFMTSVAAFCGLASVALAGSVPAFALPLCVLWIVPALYFVLDLVEDLVLFFCLIWPDTISPGRVNVAKLVQRPKIMMFGLSILQTLVLALLAIAQSH